MSKILCLSEIIFSFNSSMTMTTDNQSAAGRRHMETVQALHYRAKVFGFVKVFGFLVFQVWPLYFTR
jgi:hypothetical protein